MINMHFTVGLTYLYHIFAISKSDLRYRNIQKGCLTLNARFNFVIYVTCGRNIDAK